MRPSCESSNGSSTSRNERTRGHHHQHHHQQQSNGSNTRMTRVEWVPKNTNPSLPANASVVPSPNDPVVPSTSKNSVGILGRKPQQNHNSHRQQHYHQKEPRRRLPDESVPQLVQELRDKLTKGVVECMICYDIVGRFAPIWSCGACFCIFHLSCIKRWAKAPGSAAEGGAASWRCPGCQSAQQTPPAELRYTCFCGKSRDPAHDFYLTPHSCGEPCGRLLGAPPCVHSCVLQCHPGPCPPCKAFAPASTCLCGRKTFVRRCSEGSTDLSCGQPCGSVLACGRHRCERICHAGDCVPCEASISASCFCGKMLDSTFSCSELVRNSGFSCNSRCGKLLGCGNHHCKKKCHAGPCGECERAPSSIQSCPCGKMKFAGDRASCLDPIPCCSKQCGKLLPCGEHRCPENCHEGDCLPCVVLVSQRCRCGSSSRTTACAERMEGMFLCEKPCGQKKNCGRHRCNEKCCAVSRSSSDGVRNGDWDPHLCTVVCGKKLQCGKHFCTALCHSGHCLPCLESIFTDLSCACGMTYIPPPVPCGTPPPDCQLPCSVPQPCGHAASHSCHFGDCPPCAVLVAKECVGNHVILRNVPCGSRDIRCNRLCGKTRQCGMHACTKICHPPPCDSLESHEHDSRLKVSCGQVCGAPRRDCRHTCAAICHPMVPCPDIHCEFVVSITCSCERITAAVPCGAGGNGVHVDGVLEASVIQKLPVPLVPLDATSKRVVPLGQRKLVCDEECAKLERKKVLADAFDVPTNLDALHFGENSSTVSQLMADMMRREPKWVLAVEERFKYLVLSKGKGGNASGVRVHVFSAVNKEKRDVIRQIAERWKLSVSAAGWEPRRFLVVHVTPKSKAPSRILGCKGVTTVVHPPAFDPLIDMDPRLVVGLFDLPRDADISGLVLRFGGECELVWLNDKNALAVFGDPARSATALRRLDHGSTYHGAVVVLQNGGSSAGGSTGNAWSTKEKAGTGTSAESWKRMVQGSAGWLSQDSWGGTEASAPAWKGKENPILASKNPWNVLETVDTVQISTSQEPHLVEGNQVAKSGDRVPFASEAEVEDWEQVYD
ncbi:unnamed protein product [Victoria cruziana]